LENLKQTNSFIPAFDPMQKLFLRVFSFIIGLTVIFNLAGTLADTVAPLDDWRNEYKGRTADLHANQDRIEAVTLGNSHSDSINYSVLGIDGQSLALAAADLFEIERYAASLETKLPKLKTVFIAISYYSFSRDNATFEPFRTRRIGFYSMIPTWSPIQGDQPDFLLGKLDAITHIQSVIRTDSWQGVWTGLANNAPAADPFPYDGVRTNSVWGDCFHYTEQQLVAHAKEIAGRNVSSSKQMAHAHPGLVQDASDALARTIDRFHSRGTQVVLFTPPYYQEYNVVFGEQGSDIIEDMRQTIHNLQQRYHVAYYDFSGDSEITIHPDLFYNSDHLGECGTRVFTEKLLDAMSANGDFDK
jgi:hypothetical protein